MIHTSIEHKLLCCMVPSMAAVQLMSRGEWNDFHMGKDWVGLQDKGEDVGYDSPNELMKKQESWDTVVTAITYITCICTNLEMSQ